MRVNLPSFDINSICRFCVSKETSLLPIFELGTNGDSGTAVVLEIVEILLQEKISIDDGLPQFSCSNCWEKLQAIASFRWQCMQSFKLLHSTKVNFIADDYQSEEVVMSTHEEPTTTADDKDDKSIRSYGADVKRDGMEIGVDQMHGLFLNQEGILILESDTQKAKHLQKQVTTMQQQLQQQQLQQQQQQPQVHQPQPTTTKAARKKNVSALQVPQPYECLHCHRRYSTLSQLISHETIHSGERPFKCPYCDKGFKQRGAMDIHKRMHTDERPYKCEYCDKAFRQGGGLIVHKRVHTGEKPYQCKFCPKAFRQQSGLNAHQRLHSDNPMYQAFTQTLKREHPYKCEHCDSTFKTCGALNDHLRIHIKLESSVI